MKNRIGGVRAWMVVSWKGGGDEPWEILEITRPVFLDKAMAHRFYDKSALADDVRKVVLSEIDIIPVLLRKTVAP